MAGLHRGTDRRPQLGIEVRRELVRRFAADIDLLHELLPGRSFHDWLSDSGLGTYETRAGSRNR